MIITVTLNPAIDKTIEIKNFEVGKLNRIETVRLDAGGKGINVSKVIKSLGGDSKATGFLGRENSSFITEYLDRSNIKNEFVFVNGMTRTNLKVFDSVNKTVTEINEPGPYVEDNEVKQLERFLVDTVRHGDIVVLTGSVPKNVDKGIYGRLIKLLKQNGAKTILDAEGNLLREGIKEGPYLIKPNLFELEGLLGHRITGIKEAESLAKSLIKDYNIKIAVVSLGDKGAIFVDQFRSIFAHGLEVDTKSTVGAGDAMVAALAFSIEKKLNLNKAITMSMAAATANTMVNGTQPAALDTIKMIEKNIKFEII